MTYYVNKGMIPINGKPIIAHTISSALATSLFDRVVVSTEDAEIAEVAGGYGAEVDIRPQRLATDSATVVEVCEEFLDREFQAGRRYDTLCCLYATAPLRNAQDIAGTMELLDPAACDFSMAVTRFLHYPHQALRKMPTSLRCGPSWRTCAQTT